MGSHASPIFIVPSGGVIPTSPPISTNHKHKRAAMINTKERNKIHLLDEQEDWECLS